MNWFDALINPYDHPGLIKLIDRSGLEPVTEHPRRRTEDVPQMRIEEESTLKGWKHE